MNENLQKTTPAPIEWNGQIVITTAQLAEVYGTTAKNIRKNFQQNKDRFQAGKHYVLLTGDELREFKHETLENGLVENSEVTEIPFVGKKVNQLYLWTRRGASRHCKILGTDKAWEQFDYLEENYFDRGPAKLVLTTEQQIQLLAQGNVELSKRIDTVQSKTETLEERFNHFEKDLPLFPHEADSVSATVKKRVVEVLGGKDSNAYHNRSISQKAFIDAYRNLKRNFDVSTYKSIKRNQIDTALRIAMDYEPPLFLEEQIRDCNAQIQLNI